MNNTCTTLFEICKYILKYFIECVHNSAYMCVSFFVCYYISDCRRIRTTYLFQGSEIHASVALLYRADDNSINIEDIDQVICTLNDDSNMSLILFLHLFGESVIYSHT